MIMKKKWIETHSSESAYEHSSLYSVLHSWFKLKKKKTYMDDYDHITTTMTMTMTLFDTQRYNVKVVSHCCINLDSYCRRS